MQLQNGQRDQEKLTEKGKFGLHASPISGPSPRRDVGHLLALGGHYINPDKASILGSACSHYKAQKKKTPVQGSSLALHRTRHSFTQAHRKISETLRDRQRKPFELILLILNGCLKNAETLFLSLTVLELKTCLS